MDLCGGSSFPKEDREKLQRIADFRNSIKLSRDRKKQDKILQVSFSDQNN